jgi:hypothetical protein
MTDESAYNVIQRTTVINLGQRVFEGLLLNHLLLERR